MSFWIMLVWTSLRRPGHVVSSSYFLHNCGNGRNLLVTASSDFNTFDIFSAKSSRSSSPSFIVIRIGRALASTMSRMLLSTRYMFSSATARPRTSTFAPMRSTRTTKVRLDCLCLYTKLKDPKPLFHCDGRRGWRVSHSSIESISRQVAMKEDWRYTCLASYLR